MRCPSCSHNGTRVLDSRPVDEGALFEEGESVKAA
ncbi:NrdR family transcriptional regulator [Bacillus cereus]